MGFGLRRPAFHYSIFGANSEAPKTSIFSGCNVREHRQGEMLRPGHGVDGNPGLPFQEMHGAEIDGADAVDLAGVVVDRICARTFSASNFPRPEGIS